MQTRPASSTSTTAVTTAARTGLSLGRRTLGVGLAATVLAAGAYAYTAGNTVETSRVGDGAGTISGYQVTGVQYTLDAADPSLIDKVQFSLDAPASTVKADTDNGAGYVDCTSLGGNDWECDFATNPAVAGAGSLAVVAAS